MSGRAVRIAVAVSLLLNVFLVGGIAGGVYRWFSAERSVVAQQPRALRFAAEGLSPERQQQFTDDLQQTRRDGRALVKAGREARLEAARVLAAPSFDADAFDAALTATRNADIELRMRLERTIAAYAAQLSPEERVIFAQGLQHDGLLRVAPKPPAKK
jgi:uncharacterized membrane protein